ncbi:hypothetical protein [Rhabdaerophilum sp. SD176]|uniref:hypothetical protein n=1 Tax=Rhabdaerophilum sp. SD176 TaxID=2983548 RepID=UPI0024E01A9F|nr:hypothetical protein [Rhabdaerophilum sp. SD176]
MKHFLQGIALASALAVLSAPAAALTPSCQAEMDKHGLVRLEVINKINGFQKKRPTAQQACAVFGQLVKAEADMMKWMEDNQQWCQLPEPFVEDFRKNIQQGVKARGQVCTAAKKEAQARAQGGAPRGPAPGSGVQLPKGAL